MGKGAKELVPLLIEIQNELDQDNSLSTLAERSGYSPFHFHRMFSQAIGETPKQHVDRLPPQRFLAVRRMRAYLDYSDPPFSKGDVYWKKAADFAATRGLAHERIAYAISYDDPTLTPPDQQRLDACVPCDAEGEGDVRSLAFEGGLYAGAEHHGPHMTLIQCYRHVADGIRRSQDYVFAEGPPVQIFRHLDKDPQRHRCEVYFPVRRP
jgi:DNA gyrase inhibitor GyrI